MELGPITLTVALPLVGALVLAFVDSDPRTSRMVGLVASVATFLASLVVLVRFDVSDPALQLHERMAWIPALGSEFALAVDGVSLVLILLTTFLTPLILLASWDDITDRLEGEPFNLSLDRTESFRETLTESWREASGYAASGLQAGIGLITGLVLAVFVLYFILRDGAELWAWILRRFAPETRPVVDRAGRRAWAILGGFVRGTALIAAIDATLIGIGLWLLGVPLAFALAVLVFLGAFVPFVGAFVSGLVAVLVAFADEGWEIGLAALAVVVAVQFVEGNFLQPIIQSRTVDLHPAVILLAVAAGASLAGIPGAYLAVPVTAVVFAVIASLETETPP
jgi:putative heme transporter